MSSEAQQSIIEAAAQVFGHYGFKKASIEDIARRAGIGKGSVYLHFDSKEALFETVVRQSLGGTFAALVAKSARESSPEVKLRLYLAAKLEEGIRNSKTGIGWMSKGLGSMEMIFEMAGAGMNVILEFKERETEHVKAILSQGRDEGVFHFEDLNIATSVIVGVGFSALARLMTEADQTENCQALFDLVIRGLKAVPS